MRRRTFASVLRAGSTLRTCYNAPRPQNAIRNPASSAEFGASRRLPLKNLQGNGPRYFAQPYSSAPVGEGAGRSTSASARGVGASWSSSRSAHRHAEIRDRNRNYGAWLLAIAIGTAGLSYASVPLYRVFCQVTGFGGTVRRTEDGDDVSFITDMEDVEIVQGRPITIRFNADVSAHVPWRFVPSQSQVVVLPGEAVLAFYVAENISDSPITGIATYNVAPAKAGMYFNKVQCFCFDEQRLKPGESLDMPVFFYLDPALVQDEAMTDVKDITLSYTFFRAEDVTAEQLQQAQAAAMAL
jgi:cytochrome c oxidase assembly protein subunit 11